MRFGLSLMLCLSTASCQTMAGGATEPAPVVDSFCEVAKPFTWSRNDTRETQIEAQQWNAVGARLCQWAPPARVPMTPVSPPL